MDNIQTFDENLFIPDENFQETSQRREYNNIIEAYKNILNLHIGLIIAIEKKSKTAKESDIPILNKFQNTYENAINLSELGETTFEIDTEIGDNLIKMGNALKHNASIGQSVLTEFKTYMNKLQIGKLQNVSLRNVNLQKELRKNPSVSTALRGVIPAQNVETLMMRNEDVRRGGKRRRKTRRARAR